MSLSKEFRYYQEEADNAIYEELLINNKCIVKMFCGTGKSLLMRKCKTAQNQGLLVYVFPSLSLIDQFCSDYFTKKDCPFKISSESESTTDPAQIIKFLKKKTNKIICVTYQSYKTLLDNLGSTKINVCIYDEAHHAVGETYQKLIFEKEGETSVVKQIFFTATPKNSNGIIMYDRDNITAGMCGKMVYDYSYLTGMNEEYLNPFEIRVDMYTANTNNSIYESIARAILISGNNRVLTFHADVNTDRDTSVLNFVNKAEFVNAFCKVLREEFPEKKETYTTFKMIALDASIKMDQRRKILDNFDTTPDNEVYIISSCETIGEGIDTKKANMCVFADPKSSFVKIIQNIGRIVRKQSKISTILIPCWVDKEKYIGCDEDREKCDEVIRSDLNKDGNFNGILNVLSALKQEDEDIYDICLHYPDTYSPQEITNNLEKQGYKVLDPVEDGELLQTMEYLLEDDIDYEEYEDCDTDEEMIMRIAEDNDVRIEIHTNSLENQIERYNSECESGNTIRLYKEEEDEEGNQVYCPIVKKSGEKRSNGSIQGLNRKDRIKVDVHTNPDVRVLWKLEGDFTKEICSCVLDCEVEKYDPMEAAIAIVERAKEREKNGENLLPNSKYIIKKNCINTPELEEEIKDSNKLDNWKRALKGQKGGAKCSNNVRDYLDENLPDWRKDLDEKAIEDAINIVERAKTRKKNGFRLLPREIYKKENRNTQELEQEHKDSKKLGNWKKALKGKERGKCSNEVRDYLDENLTNWRTEINFDEKALEDAINIVERAKERVKNKINLLPRKIPNKKNRTTPELEQENKDATKLGNWKKALKGKGNRMKCSNAVRDYLDENLPNWRIVIDLDKKAMEDAKNIVERAKERVKNDGHLLPRAISNLNRTTPELEQEFKDANKLQSWKSALKGKGHAICPNKVRDYLDENFPDWRTELNEKAIEDAKNIVERANERVQNGKKLLPRAISNLNRTTPELEQEFKDAIKLGHWKSALKGSKNSICSNEVRDYLDVNLPDWRTETDLDKKAIEDAKNIVERANERVKNGFRLLPREIYKKENRNTQELEQEHKDSKKLGMWKEALKGICSCKCSNEVRDYLDKNLQDWRTEIDFDKKAIEFAKNIVDRAKERVKNGGKLVPSEIRKKENRTTPELEQEFKDAIKLGHWKSALKKKRRGICSNVVRDYLDENLPGWRVIDDETIKMNSSSSSSSEESEEEIIIKPKKKSMKLAKPSIKKETTEQRRERTKSELSLLHQRYKTMKSENLKNEFQENPDLWHQYHAISEENEKSFPEESIPRNCIIQDLDKIKTKRNKLVVDMGCGKAQIADYFANDLRFRFINYDHVSSKENVEVQDISKVPLGENDVEICILCLAMWGSNCEDYITEAYRILESGGNLYIIEATKRWSEKDENGIVIAGQEGNKLKTLLETNGFKIVCEKIEKFSYFKCTK